MRLMNMDARNQNAITLLNPYAKPQESPSRYRFLMKLGQFLRLLRDNNTGNCK